MLKYSIVIMHVASFLTGKPEPNACLTTFAAVQIGANQYTEEECNKIAAKAKATWEAKGFTVMCGAIRK